MKEVSKTEFTNDVNSGMTYDGLVAKYGLSKANIKTIAKDLGLTIKRAVKPKYVLVDNKAVETKTALND